MDEFDRTETAEAGGGESTRFLGRQISDRLDLRRIAWVYSPPGHNLSCRGTSLIRSLIRSLMDWLLCW